MVEDVVGMLKVQSFDEETQRNDEIYGSVVVIEVGEDELDPVKQIAK